MVAIIIIQAQLISGGDIFTPPDTRPPAGTNGYSDSIGYSSVRPVSQLITDVIPPIR